MASSNLLHCILFFLLISTASRVYANFNDEVYAAWGAKNIKIMNNGQEMQLSLTKQSGSLIRSKQSFLSGSFTMFMKLVQGNSAGTITSFYLTSLGNNHDEIDMEFLGNSLGQPYILHTNIFIQGVGNREQQFSLWFDPRADFHNYTILWNPWQILFMVDGMPIRVYGNHEEVGVPYVKKAMKMDSSLYNGETWATQRGHVKVDWSQAPFVAFLSNFKAAACTNSSQTNQCSSSSNPNYWWNQPAFHNLSFEQQQQLKSVRKSYLIYDYCQDKHLFKNDQPAPECAFEII